MIASLTKAETASIEATLKASGVTAPKAGVVEGRIEMVGDVEGVPRRLSVHPDLGADGALSMWDQLTAARAAARRL